MQLRDARLCLDCEELHTETACPVCASEAFAFLTRWVPVNGKRPRVRRVQPPPPRRRSLWITGATTGLALFTAARWFLRGVPAASVDRKRSKGDKKTDPEQGG
jgi:hypothetical protein